MELQDKDWICVQKINEGDKYAFDDIFTRHKSNVINLAFRITKSKEAAEDIAQDVFIKIYEGKAKPDSKCKFTTWLYRVTVNAAINYAKRRRFTVISLDEQREGQGSLLDRVEDLGSKSVREKLKEQEIKVWVQKKIDNLPEQFRSVILLYQFKGLTYSEIARILNTTEKAVERRLYHARELLREDLRGLF